MKKCKWAGDVNDEYCKECDGCTLMFEGQEKTATDCAGYEAGEEETADEVVQEEEYVEEQKTEQPIMNPPEEEKNEEPKKKTVKKEDKKKPSNSVEKQDKKEEVKNTTTEDKKSVKNDGNKVKSTVKSIRVMSGVTKEVNGTYYKFTYEQENDLATGLTEEEVAEEKEKLWAIANAEVDKQLEDVLK